MKKYLLTTLTSCALVLASPARAQVVDRVLFGNEASEQAHGLTLYAPQSSSVVSSGLLGQTGRRALVFNENPFAGQYPGIYGGEWIVVVRVSPTERNYLTLRYNGGDAAHDSERYRVNIDNCELMDYWRDAVSFDRNKAPGGFAFSTYSLPLKSTQGRDYVTVRIRSFGRFYAYANGGDFTGHQRVVTGDLPPLYAVYTSTTPNFTLADEPEGQLPDYTSAPAGTVADLAKLKTTINEVLQAKIAGEVNGRDFKPAYENNYFNIVEGMGVAYQRGIYGTTANALAAKIRTAIDSLVYINNLAKAGTPVTEFPFGLGSPTVQQAGRGWGGLYGDQALGLYLLWRAGKVTDAFLDRQVDLGAGMKSRREQWIEAFNESFQAGLTYNGRRYITNQLMEAAHSIYGASLALYALDKQKYHNAPKLGLRMIREALGIDEFTGAPVNTAFDGTLTDAEGYPTYQLGDSLSTNTADNYWGQHFHCMTAHGQGREQGWVCPSCYGNMSPRICDMYLATRNDPYLGSDGDPAVLDMAVRNNLMHSYFTYPWQTADGHRAIVSESTICWRNRYDPGRTFYTNLIVAALSGNETLLGRVWQGLQDGQLPDADTSSSIFHCSHHNYYLADAVQTLIDFGNAHRSDHAVMPSTPGQPDYVVGDTEDGIMAVKHGDEFLFINFYSEGGLSCPARAHIVTAQSAKVVAFQPEVMRYVPSGNKTMIEDVYFNVNHRIYYPDCLKTADGGTEYDIPAYDTEGHYNNNRQQCRYYQQRLGRYVVAMNTTTDETYALDATGGLDGQQAIDIATGQVVTLSSALTVAPGEVRAFALAVTVPEGSPEGIDTPAETAATQALRERASELTTFAQTVWKALSYNPQEKYGSYSADEFIRFYRELAVARFLGAQATTTAAQADSMLQVLNQAYDAFRATRNYTSGQQVPGTLDYTQNIAVSGSAQVLKTSVSNAQNGTTLYVPVQATADGTFAIRVRARGHNQDANRPSLNVAVYSVDDYVAGDMPTAEENTHVVKYDLFDYATHIWCASLKAGEDAVLAFTFSANGSGGTVDLSRTEVAIATAYDLMAAEIFLAQYLYDTYQDSKLADSDQLAALGQAISEAEALTEESGDAACQAAYDKLKAAEAAVNALVESMQPKTYSLTTTDGIYFSMPQNTSDRVVTSDVPFPVQFVQAGNAIYMATPDGKYFLSYGSANTYDLYSVEHMSSAAPITLTKVDGGFRLSSTNGYFNYNTAAAGEQIYGDKQSWGAATWIVLDKNLAEVSEVETNEMEIDLNVTIPTLRTAGNGIDMVDMTKAELHSNQGTAANGVMGSFRNGEWAQFSIVNTARQDYLLMFSGANQALEGNSVMLTLTSEDEQEIINEEVVVKKQATWNDFTPYFVSIPQLHEGNYTLVLTFKRADGSWAWTANVKDLRFAPAVAVPATENINLAQTAYLSDAAAGVMDEGMGLHSFRNGWQATLALVNPTGTAYHLEFEAVTNNAGRTITCSFIDKDGNEVQNQTVAITAGSDWSSFNPYDVELSELPAGNYALCLTFNSDGYNWTTNLRNLRITATGGETTAIGTLDNLTISQFANCYDLQGRKVSNGKLNRQMAKGLYITSGKKVIMK